MILPRRPLRWRRIAATAAVAFWLVMLAWLVRFEACPDLLAASAPGYRHVFGQGVLVRDAWMRIMVGSAPIGYSHTTIDAEDNDPVNHYRIENQMILALTVMGERQRVSASTGLSLDALYRLQHFTFALSSRAYALKVTGRRLTQGADSDFEILVRTASGTERTRVRIPDDVMIYSPMTEMALRSMRPGETRAFQVFDPASLSQAELRVTADSRATITNRGVTVEATLLTIDYHGLALKSWIDRDGAILRQETPFGWTIEACDPHEAFAADSPSGTPDILTAMAVPATGTIDRPRETRRLEVLLLGSEPDDLSALSARQTVTGSGTNGMHLLLRSENVREALPHDQPRGAPAPGEQPFLEPTPFIQARHPDMIAQAGRIVPPSAGRLEAALALCDWVHATVEKNPAVSMPSALDVLRRLEGDCNEHTYLAVALARAAGVPADIRVGLVYMDGAFYYHAWPAFLSRGTWYEIDPTFGQMGVDATHIALASGEMAGQAGLLKYFGQLRIRVLSASADAPDQPSPPMEGSLP